MIPGNEQQRLQAVRRYEVLDTPPDGAFDRITALAARHFGVPISIVRSSTPIGSGSSPITDVDTHEIGCAPGLCASALAALESGTYDDLLIDPSSPSEVASRVRAAGDAGRVRDQVTTTATRLAQLAELSHTDELTGLPNRRSLLVQLAALTSSARRHGRPLAVASTASRT